MESKKILLWGSLILNVLFLLGLLSMLLTPIWDFMMFNKSLTSMCDVIEKENPTEYIGFIERVCEDL